MITAMPRIAIASHDFDAVMHLFRDLLGMPVVDISDSTMASLGARLAMCVPPGGSNIELMCPAVADAPLSQSLEKFLDRRGEGLFALMLEAADPNAEADILLERGLEVLPLMAGAGGRDVHPRSNHGVLIRIYPTDSFQAAPEQIQTRPARSSGLSGVVRVIVAVENLDRALDVYGRQFGIKAGEPIVDGERGVASIVCEPPSGGVIELVAVVDGERPFAASITKHLAETGEGMYALVLETEDLEAARDGLTARGLEARITPEWPNGVAIEPVFGTRLLLVGS